MPVVRFSRDKRGYEHISLLDFPTRKGRNARGRILYWFRTPSGVKIGREPFDESVRRLLEEQNPALTFDWDKIATLSIPSIEEEQWRERRRLERAARQTRGSSEEQPGSPEDGGPSGTEAEVPDNQSPAVVAAPVSASVGRSARRRRSGRRRGSGGDPVQVPAHGPDAQETGSDH